MLKGLPRRSSPTGSSPLSRLGTTGGEASMSKPDLRFVKFSSLCCFWFSWRENDFDTCVGSLGDDGATNHHCQHCNGHQLQTAVTWVLDEGKKGKLSKYNFQDEGHHSLGPAVHVWFQEGSTFFFVTLYFITEDLRPP